MCDLILMVLLWNKRNSPCQGAACQWKSRLKIISLTKFISTCSGTFGAIFKAKNKPDWLVIVISLPSGYPSSQLGKSLCSQQLSVFPTKQINKKMSPLNPIFSSKGFQLEMLWKSKKPSPSWIAEMLVVQLVRSLAINNLSRSGANLPKLFVSLKHSAFLLLL